MLVACFAACGSLGEAVAQSLGAPSEQECAVKWHVPFGSPLRSPLCAAGDTAFCAKSAATVKGMDLMYSTCMAVAEAAAFHGRHPMKSSVAIDVAAAMLDGKSAARRYSLSGALGGTSESACRAVAAPAPCYTKYNASFAQDAKTLVEEFRKLEKITPRIETDREKQNRTNLQLIGWCSEHITPAILRNGPPLMERSLPKRRGISKHFFGAINRRRDP